MLRLQKLPFAEDGSNTIPSLAEVLPEYGALLARGEELTRRRTAAIAELREAAALLHADESAPSAPEVARQGRIAALLGRKAEAVPAAQAETGSRKAKLAREIDDIDGALEQIVKESYRARLAASAIIRDRIADHHKRLVRDLASALCDFHAANLSYWRLSDVLNGEGVAWGALQAAFLQPIGHPSDRSSPLGYWFRAARDAGHIGASEVPAEFR
jgi:hypothetical protein